MHVHYGILNSFLQHGYAKSRPTVGICIEVKSEKGIQKLLQHYRQFSQGSKLLPPILENSGGPLYACLACTHMNLAFRSIKN